MTPLLLPMALAAALWHADSLSETLIEVRNAEARLVMRLQVLSLLEVIDDLDENRDGEVTTAEMQAKQSEIMGYVLQHYGVWTGTDRDMKGGAPLVPTPMRLWHTPRRDGDGYRKGSVGLELLYKHDAPITDLMVESSLFLLTSPAHVDLVTLQWGEDAGNTFSLSGAEPRARFDPEGRGAFSTFLALGFRHILGGWDHLAFVAALVLASRRLRSLLGVVTAFTVAHSITLALAALGVVNLWAYTGFVEALIALSIAYVAMDCLLHPGDKRVRWIEAGVFGLIHGLGFAGFLGQSLIREQARAMALFAFNLGVELGQVLVVLGLVGVLALIPRRQGELDSFLAPLMLRRVGSAIIAALGLMWFVQRL